MKFKCVRIVPPLFSVVLLLTARVALASEETADRLNQTGGTTSQRI